MRTIKFNLISEKKNKIKNLIKIEYSGFSYVIIIPIIMQNLKITTHKLLIILQIQNKIKKS